MAVTELYRTLKAHVGVFYGLMALFAPNAAISADDVVILNNGDRITGNMKKLEYGTLQLKPVYGENTFAIEWNQVTSLESGTGFVIELSSGPRVVGSIHASPESPSEMRITAGGAERRVARSDIVLLAPLESDFWGRVNLAVEGGFDFAKANATQSTRVASALSYQSDKWSSSATLNVNRTLQDNGPSARRREITVNYRKVLWTEPWFGTGLVNLLSNDEQRLDLRATYGIGVGRPVFRTNRQSLFVLGGAAWTRERFTDAQLSQSNSAEGLVGAEYRVFRLGNLDLLGKAAMYPSLSESGRVRFDVNSSLKWTLPKHLYLCCYFWNNYDSAYRSGASLNDVGAGTAVGWEY